MDWKIRDLCREGCAPLYVQLADNLIDYIKAHSVPAGEAIPSESELMSGFGVSRMTVRLAVTRMCSAGYAVKMQGKGTFVTIPIHEDQKELHISPVECGWHEGPDMTSRLLEAFWAPPTPRYIEMLRLAPETRTFKVRRLKLRNGSVVGMETRHFAPFVCQLFEVEDFAEKPFIEMLSVHPRTAIKRIMCKAKSSPVSETEAETLEILSDSRLLVLNAVFFNCDDVPVFGGREVYIDGNFELNYELTL